jgi:rod shape-determining protein MreB and related proteins
MLNSIRKFRFSIPLVKRATNILAIDLGTPLFKRATNILAIDLGTMNTVIYNPLGEKLLDQPSVAAVYNNSISGDQTICAVGSEAKLMVGRTPGNISAIRPLKDGVIADFHITEKMLQHFIHKVHKDSFFRPNPIILVCVPCGSTQVERRAIKESVLGAGAKSVYLIDEPMAAALGAGLPIESPSGSMVVDIGGGTTEVAIISLNGIVYAESVRIGGDKFDESIINYTRRNFGSLIGEVTAEKIKQKIGTAYPSSKVSEMQVHGRNVAEGVPRSFTVNSNQILEAIQEPLSGIVGAVRTALEQAPPELAADIADKGMVLTGGGALLSGIDRLLMEETGLPVVIADDPLTCVARGGGKIIQFISKFGVSNLLLDGQSA